MRRSYQVLVISKLDYGSIFYDSAKPNAKKILEVINNTGARIITGAFRTSPVESILCEAEIPNLNNRRRTVLLNYTTKILSKTLNPSHILL